MSGYEVRFIVSNALGVACYEREWHIDIYFLPHNNSENLDMMALGCADCAQRGWKKKEKRLCSDEILKIIRRGGEIIQGIDWNNSSIPIDLIFF